MTKTKIRRVGSSDEHSPQLQPHVCRKTGDYWAWEKEGKRMTATSTSIDTYHDVGFMQTARLLREKIAIHVLRCGSLTNKEIATDLRLETSTVSGRVNELKKSRLLVEVDGRACSVTGRNVKCVAHVLNVPAHGDKT